MFQAILGAYGLHAEKFKIEPFGSGLINHTWKVWHEGSIYILQEVNTAVFRQPQHIAQNIREIKEYLNQTAPEYLFVAPITTLGGDDFVIIDDHFYRIFPFVENSCSIDFVQQPEQAYQAAKQFGQFTRMLYAFDVQKLKPTIEDFHDLPLRMAQFKKALAQASNDRVNEAKSAIGEIIRHDNIEAQYTQMVSNGALHLRVVHHDTKISNVLLQAETGIGLCVIDLDTVMPGYLISDVGDMMRTYLSEANEEERDFNKIAIRADVFAEIYTGYMEEMDQVLTSAEKQFFIYSGKFMIYMQALRFITDFLNGDIYYKTSYPKHNLLRGLNQIDLLNKYIAKQSEFEGMIRKIDRNKKEAHQIPGSLYSK
ncbi:Ser/Thr protein kinase RdoA involved in Cpx stress response, MazF antagonist [Pedobacter terrae]|uniref:Ser/Thr protein kinase RdoA involved in Cpx stress response, MazF antagonist n=1 Tax=Pedobacter terrae TaxID=405671 RepID=A0A1G7WIV8_9SPHI|nr:aminoglycoside phosphotransferase family protein [Pedobacter terrae]SDG71895.1 Ser/Thr protein kinase RdoA involved in Cpx stress response, MazF antagonist [Pedobacter terrae]